MVSELRWNISRCDTIPDDGAVYGTQGRLGQELVRDLPRPQAKWKLRNSPDSDQDQELYPQKSQT